MSDRQAGKKEGTAERAEKILEPIAAGHGVVIYDTEYVKEAGDWYLRAYIDKQPGGVTIDDCEAVSREFSDALDEADLIDEAYILEVSSPGLGRQLKKDRHLAYSVGEKVEIKTFKETDGSKEWEGTLTGFDKESVHIETEDGRDIRIIRKEIAVMRLALEL
ncbi:MAG: ribosome maturation factor RimP [Lachnospiraceae bacterium]|nr:ribosome maturation factor RimP [Lachnospiraceae bacterium]